MALAARPVARTRAARTSWWWMGPTTATPRGLIAISPYKFMGPGGAATVPSSCHARRARSPTATAGRHKGQDDPEAGQRLRRRRSVRDRCGIAKKGRAPWPAFISESLLSSCAGQVVPPEGYLAHGPTEHVRAAGGLCIADEVQVGFGRVGSHFWGIRDPGRGARHRRRWASRSATAIPLAAVVTTREVAESFARPGWSSSPPSAATP